MSHQPLLKSSDALKDYTVTTQQVAAYLKACKRGIFKKDRVAALGATFILSEPRISLQLRM